MTHESLTTSGSFTIVVQCYSNITNIIIVTKGLIETRMLKNTEDL